jgi:ribosomal RNA-processing protein 9
MSSWQGIVFRKGTQQLYTASFDRTIKLFDLAIMGYVETLFGHQDSVTSIDALRGEFALTSGGQDRTVRFWKIVDETQLVFRGGGRSKIREVLDGGLDGDGADEEPTRHNHTSQKQSGFVEGRIDCVAMLDETTFVSGGDSG